MTIPFLRRLFGLDFPDPAVGQVWRSRHSGRAVRVAAVALSDDGRLWRIDLQHEDEQGFIPIPNSYCMHPPQWRRMLRDEGRALMGGGSIEPTTLGVPPCPNASMSGGCPCGYADCTKRPRGVPEPFPCSCAVGAGVYCYQHKRHASEAEAQAARTAGVKTPLEGRDG